MKCPYCGGELSIKDTGVYSSILCPCRIIIYYYKECNNTLIKKEDYLKWKKKQALQRRTLR